MQTIKLTATQTTYVSKVQSQENFSESPVLNIGLERVASIGRFCLVSQDRALIQFGGVPGIPQHASIVHAELHVYIKTLKRKMGCRCTIGILENMEDFDAQTVTWDTMPQAEATGCSLYFTQSDVPGYVCCDITGLAVGWHTGKTPNYGIVLKIDKSVGDFVQASSVHSQETPFLSVQVVECGPEKLMAQNREYIFEINGLPGECFSPAVDLFSAQTATFFIKNTSGGVLKANLQVSPDSKTFIDDAQTLDISAGETNALTPYFFSRYCRVRLFAQDCISEPVAKIWCQIQTRDYYMH